jgi:hypothetical protein
MKKIIFGFLMAGLATISSNVAFASTSSCLGSPTTSLTTANSDTSNGLPGCETGDKVFGNFVLQAPSTTGVGGTAASNLGQIYILGSGSAPNITAEFDANTNQWSANPMFTGAGTVTQELDWTVNVDSTDSGGFLLQGLNVGSIAADTENAGFVQITFNICPTGSFSPGCAGEISLNLGQGSGSSTTSGELMFSNGLTNIASIQALITVTAPSSSDFAGLTNFQLTFDQGIQSGAPEPSTFILLGSALGCIGAFRWRKRKLTS